MKPNEIILGGMPSLCLNSTANPFFWFKGYKQTYPERDIRELSRVADLLSFRNALQLAALRTGQVLKISELARDAKLNSTTMSRYLNLAETSFVLRRIPPYIRNKSSRLIKSPKVYISDSGLACHLAGIKDLETESNVPFRGAMIETYVAQNLLGIIETKWPESQIFFRNIQGRHEVDFIITYAGEIMAIEVRGAVNFNSKCFFS